MPILNSKEIPSADKARGRLINFLDGPVPKYFHFDRPTGVVLTTVMGKTIPWSDWTDFRDTLVDIDGFVGMGRDRTVVKGSKDRVIGVYHEPQEWGMMRESFSIHRIFNWLFPHNFPRFDGLFGFNDFEVPPEKMPPEEDFYYTGFVSEHIKGISATKVNWQEGFLGGYQIDPKNFVLTYPNEIDSTKVPYPFQQVLDKCEQIEMPLQRMEFDFHPGNFKVRQDGGEFYLDILKSAFWAEPKLQAKDWWKGSDVIAAKINEQVSKGTIVLNPGDLEKIQRELYILGD